MTGSDLADAAWSFRTGATIVARVPATIVFRIIIRVVNGRRARPGWAWVKNGRLWRRTTWPATGARYVFVARVLTYLISRFVSSVGSRATAVSAGAVSAVWTAASSPPSAVPKWCGET